MRTFKKLLFIFAAILPFLYWCKSNSNMEPAGTTDSLGFDTMPVISYLLPAPDEILNDVLPTKIAVNIEYVNSLNNAEKYLDTKSQALNLGVYLADFAYVNLHETKANSVEYLRLIKGMTQKLGVYGYFNDSTFTRIQNNLMNKDSLTRIGQEMYQYISTSLDNSGREEIFTLVTTGALIECLYLSSMSIGNYNDYKLAAKRLLEKKYLFKDYYLNAIQYKKDQNVTEVLLELEDLYNMTEAMEVTKTEKTVTKDKENHLLLKGGERLVVNEKVFNDFREKVKSTRQEIISYSKENR